MNFAGLELKNPIIIASGPTTARVEHLIEAEKYGAAGVSIKHVMTRQKYPGKLRCYSEPEGGALTGQNPRLSAAIVEATKAGCGIPVLAKLTPTALDIGGIARA